MFGFVPALPPVFIKYTQSYRIENPPAAARSDA
jgi:hypothetical protein